MDRDYPANVWAALCTKVLAWDGIKNHFPKEAVLIRNGPSSLAFCPSEQEDVIVKVIRPGRNPRGAKPMGEYDLLKKVQELKGAFFISPKPLTSSNNYIVMERLKGRIDVEIPTPEDAARIGTGLGEFAGILFKTHGVIHFDLCWNNYTKESDGKIGILDIASIDKEDIPEKMFLTLLLDPGSPHICLALADKFKEITGRPLDLEFAIGLSEKRMPVLLAEQSKSDATRLKARHNKNIGELKTLLHKRYIKRLEKSLRDERLEDLETTPPRPNRRAAPNAKALHKTL